MDNVIVMDRYRKQVLLHPSCVEAIVYRHAGGSNSERDVVVAIETFYPFPLAFEFFLEGRFKAAHRWADKIISVCERQEKLS